MLAVRGRRPRGHRGQGAARVAPRGGDRRGGRLRRRRAPRPGHRPLVGARRRGHRRRRPPHGDRPRHRPRAPRRGGRCPLAHARHPADPAGPAAARLAALGGGAARCSRGGRTSGSRRWARRWPGAPTSPTSTSWPWPSRCCSSSARSRWRPASRPPRSRLLRDRGQRWPTWLFLAGRRLGATSHLAVILLAASATAVGVFVYAGTLTHTLDVTLDAKAQTARGSDVVVETVGPPTVPAAYRDRATVVRALIDTQISSPQVDVVAVDPATFDRGVLWDPSFADESLDTLLGRLDRPTTAAGLPAILVNGGLPPGNRLDFVDPRYPRPPDRARGHRRGLPGRQPHPSAGGGLDRRAGGGAEPARVTGVDRWRRRRRQPGVRPGRQPGAVPSPRPRASSTRRRSSRWPGPSGSCRPWACSWG